MATLTVIDAAQAPARKAVTPSSLLRRQAEYEGYVGVLKKGQVGRLVPSSGETARALSSRVGWASRRTGRQTERWIVDGTVYFKVV